MPPRIHKKAPPKDKAPIRVDPLCWYTTGQACRALRLGWARFSAEVKARRLRPDRVERGRVLFCGETLIRWLRGGTKGGRR